MPRETRDEAIKRADAATKEAFHNWDALLRVLATDQRKDFPIADGHFVTVTYPPRPGAHEDSYTVINVDRENGNIQVHNWDDIKDYIRYAFHYGTDMGHETAAALEKAQMWIHSHMRGEVTK